MTKREDSGAMLLVLYSLPPTGLLLLALGGGWTAHLLDVIAVAVRAYLTALAAFGIGVAGTQNWRILDHHGWRFHVRFFPIYVGLFLALWVMLGVDLRYSDPGELILRP